VTVDSGFVGGFITDGGAHMTVTYAFSTRESIALIVSASIVAASACYWIAQIAGVIEMLRLAYG
jgi:hypothetical protein